MKRLVALLGCLGVSACLLTGCTLPDIKFDTFSDVRWPLTGSEIIEDVPQPEELGDTSSSSGSSFNTSSVTYNGTITKLPRTVDVAKYNAINTDIYNFAVQWDADCTRLANVMKRAEAGETITIACIGGSITEGATTSGNLDAAVAGRACYAQRYFDWWALTFPNATFNFINAGIGGTDSYFGVHRVYDDVLSQNPDVVLVEFSVNDNNDELHRQSYDNLLRRILLNSDNTACMLLFMQINNGHTCKAMDLAIGQSYGLPMISYADVLNLFISTGAYSLTDLAADQVHPTAYGHAVIGQLISQYLDNVRAIEYECGPNTPFTCPPVTNESFAYARTIPAGNALSPDEYGNYSGIVTFSRLGLAYCETADGTGGNFEVIVDGVSVGTFNTVNRDNMGAPMRTVEFVNNVPWGEHSVEVRNIDSSSGNPNLSYVLAN